MPGSFLSLKDVLQGAEWYIKAITKDPKAVRAECCNAINDPFRDSYDSTKITNCLLQQLRGDPHQELLFPYNISHNGTPITKRAKILRKCLADFWMQYPLMSVKTHKIENEDKSLSFDLPFPYLDPDAAEKLPNRLSDLWVTCVQE